MQLTIIEDGAEEVATVKRERESKRLCGSGWSFSLTSQVFNYVRDIVEIEDEPVEEVYKQSLIKTK